MCNICSVIKTYFTRVHFFGFTTRVSTLLAPNIRDIDNFSAPAVSINDYCKFNIHDQ